MLGKTLHSKHRLTVGFLIRAFQGPDEMSYVRSSGSRFTKGKTKNPSGSGSRVENEKTTTSLSLSLKEEKRDAYPKGLLCLARSLHFPLSLLSLSLSLIINSNAYCKPPQIPSFLQYSQIKTFVHLFTFSFFPLFYLFHLSR